MSLNFVGCILLTDIILVEMSGFGQFSLTVFTRSRFICGIRSYFDGYVNASTTLQMFTKQYEKALESRYEKEVKADYETMNISPLLKTPSPMEKQAAGAYTRKLFIKFQEELVETLAFLATKVEDSDATYQVSKFGETHKVYFARYNVGEMKVSCSCQMFQFSGLLCLHILSVFRVTNVLTLPSSYVMKRWTRNAKSSVALEGHKSNLLNSSREPLTVRYSNLRREALKYVDEGVETLEIYEIALGALREAANKVDIAKKNSGKISNLDSTSKGDQPESMDDEERKIQKLSRQVERVQRKCEVYRSSLLFVLKDIEQQKQLLTVKVQIIKFGTKE